MPNKQGSNKPMARKKTNPHVGSNFETFVAEGGRLQESTALAIKRVLAG